MIRRFGRVFVLDTDNTTYCFRITKTGHMEHLYYGRKITVRTEADADCLTEKHAFAPGNTSLYDNSRKDFSPEDICYEMSAWGKGDIREPFIEVIHSDGSRTSDFLYEKYEFTKTKNEFASLPGSYSENGRYEHLCVYLRDKEYGLKLELHYYVYPRCNVITRSTRFINESSENVRLERIMSLFVDFSDNNYVMTTFNGGWIKEMGRNDTVISSGKHVNASFTGTSSNRANPFVMLSRENTDENSGSCYGFNLIYSGNHYEAAEVNSFGKTRFVSGINPDSFSFVIAPDEAFEAPEGVMTFSCAGFNGLSSNMHAFIREHIVRGEWKKRTRPVLLNSWEACYFDISENKLYSLAKASKNVGIELFVMDDGWFSGRDNDTKALGDWTPDRKKLPGGIKGICDKVKALGLEFGIWVEPEMISTDSDLYRSHPEYAVDIPTHPHSEGRNQRFLDLTDTEVQEYVITEMSRVFSSADISYVKWDMNRNFTDLYSKKLAPERQGEFAHRYVMGLYRCMKELTDRFPHILFEGCASGGNRFDLGILCCFPQIWASDNTDAVCRSEIQNGYSYGYPMSVLTAHVSASPNHQTLRTASADTMFNIACFGLLGYECDLSDMNSSKLEEIKQQITLYKKWRNVLQNGSFYRGRNGNVTEWVCVSGDKKKAVGCLLQKQAAANHPYECFRLAGLDENRRYHFYNIPKKHNIKEFGSLVNAVSPVHIKQDSVSQDILAKLVKMDGEKEECYAYGDTLMNCGVKLHQGYCGSGFNNEVRLFRDGDSGLYFIEAEE